MDNDGTRDILSPGKIKLETKSPRTFVWGHIVSGPPVTPPCFKGGVTLRYQTNSLWTIFNYYKYVEIGGDLLFKAMYNQI